MKLPIVEKMVTETYQTTDQEWGSWIWQYHVPFVAEHAKKLCGRFGGKEELAVAGAWLHDFGDAFVFRFDESHEAISRKEAEKILHAAEYSPEEIKLVLEEVIAAHSCDDVMPTLHEGKIMATADALAHLTTDFYTRVCWMHIPQGKTYEEFKEWLLMKIERDFYKKIFFDEVREEVRQNYEALKTIFSK